VATPGVAIGTVPYMSPEQARGEQFDVRTDLFSFGAVLYEMATGKQAFTGATTAMIHEGILGRAPMPASAVNVRIPQELDRIIGRALEKDRLTLSACGGRAWGSEAGEAGHGVGAGGGIAVTLLAAAISYQVWKPAALFRTSSPPAQPTHRQITFVGDATYPALSPDRRSVAYVTAGKETHRGCYRT